MTGCQPLCLCIHYEVDGQLFWDNNGGSGLARGWDVTGLVLKLPSNPDSRVCRPALWSTQSVNECYRLIGAYCMHIRHLMPCGGSEAAGFPGPLGRIKLKLQARLNLGRLVTVRELYATFLYQMLVSRKATRVPERRQDSRLPPCTPTVHFAPALPSMALYLNVTTPGRPSSKVALK